MMNHLSHHSHSLFCPGVLKILLLVATTRLFLFQGLVAQPILTERPLFIKTTAQGHPSIKAPAMSFTGDPFTRITEGDIVNDGTVVTSTGCSWADYDNDGDLDLYSCNYGSNNFFYVNNGDGTFTKITAVHIIHPGNSNAGIWADYDNDGDLDLIVANDGIYFDQDSWFKSNGDGSFVQIVIGDIANDNAASQGVCWADYDNDGHLDLFVPCGLYSSQSNHLYHNNGEGTFTRITTGDIGTDLGTFTSASWSDFDNDGDLDLFVVNLSSNNFFYVNNGDGTFTRDTTAIINENGGEGTWGSSWGDYDNDGYTDLFISRWGHNGLYRNNGDGSFTKDTTAGIGAGTSNSVVGIWADYDNDGELDLFVANAFGGGNFLYKNNGNGTFTNDTSSIVANEGGNSEACAWGDYDNDGDLDLFVSNSGENNYLYRNNGNGNSWINILCIGSASNRSGIGAKVRAKATISGNPVWQLREVEGQTSFRSQSSLNVEFGFADATTIDSLVIQWPSGIWDVYTNVGVNQFMTAIEGQAIPSVEEGDNHVPSRFELKQNYPNPFNPSTKIRYSVPHSSHVTLKIYNTLGQEVATLVDENQESGPHEVEFNGKMDATAAYFYQLQAGTFVETKKLVILK